MTPFLEKDEAYQYDWHACLKNGLARRLGGASRENIGTRLMTILRYIFFIFGLVLFANTGYAQEPSATPSHPAGAQIVTGEVLKIEGETYVIRDAFGKEVRLRVDQNSKIEGSPKVGDRIEAQVLEGGWASILSKR